ncbi:MAG: Acetyltransferase domain [Cyanobacteria bacterium RYN_339]|nr:Acetyltransferase domain [Cyanobacteria bacterium RYN_339]
MSTAVLTHPSTNEDWEKLLAFSKLVHPRDAQEVFVRLYKERPDLVPENHAMLVEDGEVLATASLLPHHHYFGDAELEVGELALVGTHPDRRMEGHARRLVAHWLEEAKKSGLAYVYLYGIPRMYETFGFSYAAPAHFFPYLRMTRDVLEAVMSPYRVRPMIPADVVVMEELYDRANCRTPMAEVRSHEYWTYRLTTTRQRGFSWWVTVDENNTPHGYIWADLEKGRLREVVAADEEAARAILQWMRWELAERKLPEFSAQVPLNQTFARYAHRAGAMIASPHTAYPGNWAAMIKILRFQPVIEGLKTQFEERINESRYARQEFSFTLVSGEDAVNVRWQENRIKVGPGAVGHEIRLPSTVWGPLLTGYRTIDDYPHMELDEKERHLLRVLFPGGNPYIWDLEQSDEL